MLVALQSRWIMREAADPILTQFGVPPNRGSGALALEVDRSTGLLHESGVAVPFVEEMIEMGVRWRNLGAAATVLTESTDPIDPDLIRADSAWLRFGQALVTDLTKTVSDPVDPDVVRDAWLQWAVESAATTITREQGDEPDPDLVRAEPLRSFNGNAATDRTHVDGDQPDPDLLRLEIVHDQRLNVG
jgi:hypothetical protein